MTDSPTNVDFKQLRELYVQSTWKEKKKEDAAPAAASAASAPAAQ
jgi:aspartyl-tRNA synthetase